MRLRNPCLICGVPSDVPKSAAVCGSCKSKVRRFDAMEKTMQDALGGSKPVAAMLARSDAMLSARLPDRRGDFYSTAIAKVWEPFPVLSWAQVHDLESKKPSELTVRLDGPRGKWTYRRYQSGSGWTGNTLEPRAVPGAIADALLSLEDLFDSYGSECYEAGKAEGQNLIAQLAAGTVLSDEFERRVGIQLGKRK